MRSSTFRALTGAALTAGLLGATAGTAAAQDAHTVEPGETLAGIADRYDGVTWRDLHEANAAKISDPAVIIPGQRIALSATQGPDQHEVEAGETLAAIAGTYDHVASWRALAAANADVVSDPNLLLPGQVLSLDADAPAAPEPQPEPQPEAEAEPAPEPEPEQTTATDGVWDRLAACESGGNWSIDSGNGYYGGLQFTLDSWEAVGGSGYPHEASREEQIQRAEQLQAVQGWDAWPACADQLGLR